MQKDLDDVFFVYANMKKINETVLEKLKSLKWNNYPKNIKVFILDFCILNGDAYAKYFID